MIALDGEFFRADVDGGINPIPPQAKTPFAVVTRFEPRLEDRLDGRSLPRGAADLSRRAGVRPGASSCAFRIDGRFELGPAPLGPRASGRPTGR